MSDRRAYLGAATDAILEYWLAGTHDSDMAEWWTTDEAVDTAGEMFSAVMDEWERKGLRLPWTEVGVKETSEQPTKEELAIIDEYEPEGPF